jgi:hypothetical protein
MQRLSNAAVNRCPRGGTARNRIPVVLNDPLTRICSKLHIGGFDYEKDDDDRCHRPVGSVGFRTIL